MGWGELFNGDLLKAAEQEGFSLFVTADKNIRYQQNLAGRRIAIIELSTNDWGIIKNQPQLYVSTVNSATEGSYQTILYEPPPRRPKPFRGPSF